MSARHQLWLTDDDWAALDQLRRRHADARRNRAMVRLGDRALRRKRCRDLMRWLAFAWLLLTGAMGLMERRAGRP